MNQIIKEEWLSNLRSNIYNHGKFALRQVINEKEYHCPLGVLCELYRKKFKAYWELAEHSKTKFTIHQKEGILPDSVRIWAELKLSNPLLGNELITDLNDRECLSFEKMADLIEKYL